jgi:hypothetical protein
VVVRGTAEAGPARTEFQPAGRGRSLAPECDYSATIAGAGGPGLGERFLPRAQTFRGAEANDRASATDDHPRFLRWRFLTPAGRSRDVPSTLRAGSLTCAATRDATGGRQSVADRVAE